MVFELSKLVSSQLFPFLPLQVPRTQEKYPPTYSRSLIQFYVFFTQITQAYSWQNNSLENYQRFQNQFQVTSERVTVQPQANLSPKQSELIRTIDALFPYIVDLKLQINSEVDTTLNKTKEDKGRSAETLSQHLSLPSPPKTSLSNQTFQLLEQGILSLPTELLLYIFENHATDWRSAGNLALTCKTFYQIINDPYSLKRFFKNSSPLFPSISYPLNLQLIGLTGFEPSHFGQELVDLSDEELKFIADHGSNLTSLALVNSKITPLGLANLLKRCPQLHTLEFRQCSAHFDAYMSVVGLYAKGLEHLKISDCAMSDPSLFALGICTPNLRSFEYENSQGQGLLSDYGLIPFLTRTSQLETIKLMGCSKVTQLSLMSYIKKKSLQVIRKGFQLKHLTFSYCSVMDERLFDSLAKYCPNLETLELGFSPTQCSSDLELKRRSLIGIAKNCSRLHSLKLVGCRYLSSPNVNEILNNCSNLTQLELVQCLSLNDVDLSNCSKLHYLNFQPTQTYQVSLEYLNNLKINCPDLKSLTLFDCVIKEADLLVYLEKSSLRQLQLMKCGSFGSPLLNALSLHCPTLESLEIEITGEKCHPQPFEDKDIENLARNCPSLTMLTLKSTNSSPITYPLWQLSELSLEYLARHCPDLRHLNLSHLDLLSKGSDSLNKNIIKFFTEKCLKITHLGFPAAQATDDLALSFILPYRHQLQSLSLEHNDWLTSGFLNELRKCSCLQYLWLKQSWKDSLQLANLFPHLKYSDL